MTLSRLSVACLLCCCISLFATRMQAQTTLTAGDIAFTGINTDNPDQFSFLLLKDITVGTVIRFTDNGWQSSGSFRANEGTFTWTSTAANTCGTQVTIAAGTNGMTFTASTGTPTFVSGAFQLAGSGDQVLAYQGTDAAPVFIAGINIGGAWASTASTSNNSALPSALTNGTTAIALTGATTTDGRYDCSVLNGGKAILDTAVNNATHWAISTSTRFALPPTCSFSCSNQSVDCAGVVGGTATYDNCNICSGGTTGVTPNVDTDNDGTLDCNDLCPNDPNKIAPGICGCGKADTSLANAGTNIAVCVGQTTILTASGSGNGTYSWSNGTHTASNTVTVTAGATNFIVTVTNGAGCVSKDTVVVTGNALPVASAGNDTAVCAGQSITLTATGGGTYAWSNGATTATNTVSPLVLTTYTVTVTNSNNCTASDAVAVRINQLPTASVGNDTAVCAGQSVTLTATGGTIVLWSTGANTPSILYTPVNTSDVIATVTDNNNCSASDTVHVTVNAVPNISAGNDQIICLGDTATFTAINGNSYLWNTGATTASISVSPAIDTSYTVTGTSINGCSAIDTVALTVNVLPIVNLGADRAICIGDTTTLQVLNVGTYLWNTGATTDSINVSPIVPTTYSITVTNSDNCSASDSITLNVNARPIIDAGANKAICLGDSTALTATGGATYTWSNTSTTASTTVAPIITTTYIVVGVDTNVCFNVDSVVVTVNPLPVVSFTGLDSAYCSNGPSSTLVGSPAGGTFSGTGVSSTSFDPTAAGLGQNIVSYTYTDANSCTAATTDSTTVSVCTGIENISNGVAVNVYPNPFNGQLTLQIGQADQPLKVSLYDMMGRVMLAQQATEGTTTIATDHLPAGLYLFEVKGNGVFKTFRLVHAE